MQEVVGIADSFDVAIQSGAGDVTGELAQQGPTAKNHQQKKEHQRNNAKETVYEEQEIANTPEGVLPDLAHPANEENYGGRN